jgi:hypothetical protein
MLGDIKQIYDRLYSYAERESFAGWDPFDGLNSRVFQITPLKYSRYARLAWLQMVKRSATNLRPALLIDKGVNPKAPALFALAELSRYRSTPDQKHAENARDLIDRMLGIGIAGDGWTAFGYNFDWQSRSFYAPKGTPAIVPTAFAQQALIEAYEAFGDKRYLKAAEEICKFILTKLNRPIETDDEICFSYTPIDRAVIYNASLLAGECLARIGAITSNDEYLTLAAKTARFVIRRQRNDGAWSYGAEGKQAWVDNFHTAYILLSLQRIADRVREISGEVNDAIACGRSYWLNNFFLAEGVPKYYDKETYPIDIHSAAAAIVGLCELEETDLAKRVGSWTIDNMLDSEGFFYYQKRKNGAVKTPFMRWGQAWMAYALARLIEIGD